MMHHYCVIFAIVAYLIAIGITVGIARKCCDDAEFTIVMGVFWPITVVVGSVILVVKLTECIIDFVSGKMSDVKVNRINLMKLEATNNKETKEMKLQLVETYLTALNNTEASPVSQKHAVVGLQFDLIDGSELKIGECDSTYNACAVLDKNSGTLTITEDSGDECKAWVVPVESVCNIKVYSRKLRSEKVIIRDNVAIKE